MENQTANSIEHDMGAGVFGGLHGLGFLEISGLWPFVGGCSSGFILRVQY